MSNVVDNLLLNWFIHLAKDLLRIRIAILFWKFLTPMHIAFIEL
jgi:hypothetical protein